MFGEKLKALRNATGKSQALVVLEISHFYPNARISQTYLSALENRADAPREEVCTILAKYYNVDLLFFYDRSEQRKADGVEVAKHWLKRVMSNATNIRYDDDFESMDFGFQGGYTNRL